MERKKIRSKLALYNLLITIVVTIVIDRYQKGTNEGRNFMIIEVKAHLQSYKNCLNTFIVL